MNPRTPLGQRLRDMRTRPGQSLHELGCEVADALDLAIAALNTLNEIDGAYGIDLNEPQRDQMHDAIRKAESA